MNTSKTLLEMLKRYEVEHVFGLPGETTLPLYKEWHEYPEIEHILARDERSSVFMAEVYSRFSFKPGICEGPSVGSTHMIPGVVEAYKSSTPMIVITSDIPLHLEKRNMLTGVDQTAMFQGITKESLTLTDSSELPNLIRRAFRVATTGRPGPVHLRLPSDKLEEDIKSPLLYSQEDFFHYPGHRPCAEKVKILEAMKLLGEAERPVAICGQGVLYSQAWDEVVELAELYTIPVGTTINGKGSFPEGHPLSLGVVGARGGTGFSNRIVNDSDLILFIGSSTDSASTDKWNVPSRNTEAKIVSLNITGDETGNNYDTDVFLIGDAKETLRSMITLTEMGEKNFLEQPRIQSIIREAKNYNEYVSDLSSSTDVPIHPLRFIKELYENRPPDYMMVMDVGTAAIYTSTYFKQGEAGRRLAYNFAMGALGFAIPASIGAHIARPDDCVIGLVGDGSFGLAAAELETISRIGGNINLILFNNKSYGWIRSEMRLSYGDRYVDFSTNFKEVDYLKIAEGFGIQAYKVSQPRELSPILGEAFNDEAPSFIEVKTLPEDKLVPPVPTWLRKAKARGIPYIE
jgi:acetolactate synthase-1/2/3 large subunit